MSLAPLIRFKRPLTTEHCAATLIASISHGECSMKTTVEFLNEAKARLDVKRDIELAARLGVTKQNISMLRNGESYFGDETARRVAEIIGIDPANVIACAYAERARDPQIKSVWLRMAESFATFAATAVIGAGAMPTPSESSEFNQSTIARNAWLRLHRDTVKRPWCLQVNA